MRVLMFTKYLNALSIEQVGETVRSAGRRPIGRDVARPPTARASPLRSRMSSRTWT